MKKSKFTEEQIAYALKQAELGTPVAEVCRKMGISDATFYNWRTKYGGLSPSELRRLKQLEEENAKLKRLVADLSLDKAMLQDVLSKMYGPPRLCKASVVNPTHVSLRKCIRPLASRTLLAFRP
ncbi:putative transposase (plasmid) [Burkholderia sola]|nr:putative transposase [Burkholderia cenocepacia]CAG2383887.1 putative transposase [Burkholderia cenocepacia]CAG2383900.1 putative transposase [Burkholderia cenocepacia]CAG2383957.1 putative transposase [Burkholderia cenocepacia]CAG2384001.1 putative transposase [Burkholderia cenocepacia]